MDPADQQFTEKQSDSFSENSIEQPGSIKAPTDKNDQTVAFGSVSGGIGVSTTAINVVATMATSGMESILADLSVGSTRASGYFGLPTGTHFIKNYFTGKLNSLKSALRKTPVQNLTLIESGLDYFNFADKRLRFKKNLIKKLGRLGSDRLVIDLGALTNNVKLDYFLMSDVSVLVIKPEKGSLKTLKRLIIALAARAVDTEFHRWRFISKAARKAADNFYGNEGTLLETLRKPVEKKPELLDKFDKLFEAPFVHLIINRATSMDDVRFGVEVKELLEQSLGMKIGYLGFVPDDEYIKEAADKNYPVTHLDPTAPLTQVYKKITANIVGATDIEYDVKAIDAINQLLERQTKKISDSLDHEIAKVRSEKLDDLEREILIIRRQRIVEIDSELAAFKLTKEAELDGELNNAFEAANAKLTAELETKKREELDKILDKTSQLEAERNKELRTLKNKRLENLQSEVDRIKDSRLDNFERQFRKTRESQFEQLAIEIEKAKEAASVELARYKEEKYLELNKSLKALEDKRIAQFHATALKDVDKVRRAIWQDLEDDKQNRISEIDKELATLKLLEMELLNEETEEYRARIKAKADKEAKETSRSLIESAHHDVMRISGAFDDEFYPQVERMRESVQHEIALERERLMSAMRDEIEAKRENRLKELVDYVNEQRTQRLNELDMEITEARERALLKETYQLREESAIRRKRINEALNDFRARSKRRVEFERDTILFKLEKAANDYKLQKEKEINRETKAQYKKMAERMEQRASEQEAVWTEIIERDKQALKALKAEELEKEIDDVRQQKLKKLTEEMNQRKVELTNYQNNQLAQMKESAIRNIENEAALLKSTKENELDREIASNRTKLVGEMNQLIKNEKDNMLAKLAEKAALSEKSNRIRMLKRIDTERKELLDNMKAETRRKYMRREIELDNEIEEKREAEYKKLKQKIAQLKNQSAEKLAQWEEEEKKRRITLMNARLSDQESAKLTMIEQQLEADSKTASGAMRDKLYAEKQESIRQVDEEFKRLKSGMMNSIENDVALEKEKLLTEAKVDVAREMESKARAMAAQLDQDMIHRRSELAKKLDAEMAESRRRITEEVAEEKAAQQAVFEEEYKNAQARMNEALTKRRNKLWEKQKEWVQYEVEQLRAELNEDLNKEIQLESNIKRAGLESKANKEIEQILKKAESEANIKKRETELAFWSELERSRDDEMRKIRAEMDAELRRRRDELNETIKAEHKKRIDKLDTELLNEKNSRFEMMMQELEVEKQKKLDLTNIEIKTEEYKRRQELIAEIMTKRTEMETALHEEKQRYIQKLKEELLQTPSLNQSALEAELNRISKTTWRLN